MITDRETQAKWDRAAPRFDLMAGVGAERRWLPYKQRLFGQMNGKVLFVALGTGLDIAAFPPGREITAIDISPEMVKRAEQRVRDYPGTLRVEVRDVCDLDFGDHSFDQVFTSCTFCSVPDPMAGLRSLRRVLRPGGELLMFEHTGSRYFPLSVMMKMMSRLTEPFGPSMSRPTERYVAAAGFEQIELELVYLDVVKMIRARSPGP